VEKGMVFALEPKIGIEGTGMVGVENTYEVTEDGCRCLTGDDFGIVCVE
jgi:Xaa-Pro dipeptidase